GKPDPRLALDPREHMIGVLSETGYEHHDSMRQDEEHKPAKRDEVDRAGGLAVQYFPKDPRAVGDRRALHEAGQDRNRRGDEHRDEVAELLQAVVTGPARFDGKVE